MTEIIPNAPPRWWHTLPDNYTAAHLKRAEQNYIARFGVFPGKPYIWKVTIGYMLAYDLPQVEPLQLTQLNLLEGCP